MEEDTIKKLKEELENYKTAYYIFMDCWEYIPDDLKEEVDEKLRKLGL